MRSLRWDACVASADIRATLLNNLSMEHRFVSLTVLRTDFRAPANGTARRDKWLFFFVSELLLF